SADRPTRHRPQQRARTPGHSIRRAGELQRHARLRQRVDSGNSHAAAARWAGGRPRASGHRCGMMDVIIVDDEPAARRTLRECCAREADLRIVGEYGDSGSALEAIRGRPPDLLFLDIQMDLLSGIALARALDPRALPLIVFVTAYDHYALEAFEVSAVDYLLKPFDDERFRRTLERSEEHTSELQSPCNLVCRLLLEKKKTTSHPSTAPSDDSLH